ARIPFTLLRLIRLYPSFVVVSILQFFSSFFVCCDLFLIICLLLLDTYEIYFALALIRKMWYNDTEEEKMSLSNFRPVKGTRNLYGSVTGYIREALNVTDTGLERLRSLYKE
ncbi:MAG: hypothetical protein IJ251_06720, partial [Oscillospiraceae bacterium]|nr:hypothetical protein [Oscillospiraceae bacterium]